MVFVIASYLPRSRGQVEIVFLNRRLSMSLSELSLLLPGSKEPKTDGDYFISSQAQIEGDKK